MNAKHEITMSWDEAPDTITPEIYAKIRGHSTQWARERFKERDFPKLESGKMIADKTVLRLYDMGINPKQNQKAGIEMLILLELQKITKKGEETNEKN